jgi:hypothetical protein
MLAPRPKERLSAAGPLRHAGVVRRLEIALVLLAAALTAALLWPHGAWSPPSPYCHSGPVLAGVYHSERLHVRDRCVVAAGVVTRVKFEKYDGDVHLDLAPDDRRLLGGRDELVVEVLPQDRATVPIPAEGTRVTVVGPWVDDVEHGWREIHPAWWISSGRLVPATPPELEAVERLLRSER